MVSVCDAAGRTDPSPTLRLQGHRPMPTARPPHAADLADADALAAERAIAARTPATPEDLDEHRAMLDELLTEACCPVRAMPEIEHALAEREAKLARARRRRRSHDYDLGLLQGEV